MWVLRPVPPVDEKYLKYRVGRRMVRRPGIQLGIGPAKGSRELESRGGGGGGGGRRERLASTGSQESEISRAPCACVRVHVRVWRRCCVFGTQSRCVQVKSYVPLSTLESCRDPL